MSTSENPESFRSDSDDIIDFYYGAEQPAVGSEMSAQSEDFQLSDANIEAENRRFQTDRVFERRVGAQGGTPPPPESRQNLTERTMAREIAPGNAEYKRPTKTINGVVWTAYKPAPIMRNGSEPVRDPASILEAANLRLADPTSTTSWRAGIGAPSMKVRGKDTDFPVAPPSISRTAGAPPASAVMQAAPRLSPIPPVSPFEISDSFAAAAAMRSSGSGGTAASSVDETRVPAVTPVVPTPNAGRTR